MVFSLIGYFYVVGDINKVYGFAYNRIVDNSGNIVASKVKWNKMPATYGFDQSFINQGQAWVDTAYSSFADWNTVSGGMRFSPSSGSTSNTPILPPTRCELIISCSNATCIFDNKYFINDLAQDKSNYQVNLQPNVLDNNTFSNWQFGTITHDYGTTDNYTAELKAHLLDGSNEVACRASFSSGYSQIGAISNAGSCGCTPAEPACGNTTYCTDSAGYTCSKTGPACVGTATYMVRFFNKDCVTAYSGNDTIYLMSNVRDDQPDSHNPRFYPIPEPQANHAGVSYCGVRQPDHPAFDPGYQINADGTYGGCPPENLDSNYGQAWTIPDPATCSYSGCSSFTGCDVKGTDGFNDVYVNCNSNTGQINCQQTDPDACGGNGDVNCICTLNSRTGGGNDVCVNEIGKPNNYPTCLAPRYGPPIAITKNSPSFIKQKSGTFQDLRAAGMYFVSAGPYSLKMKIHRICSDLDCSNYNTWVLNPSAYPERINASNLEKDWDQAMRSDNPALQGNYWGTPQERRIDPNTFHLIYDVCVDSSTSQGLSALQIGGNTISDTGIAATPTPIPTPTPTPIPTPTPCPSVSMPVNLNPSGTISAGTQNISWDPVSGADHYALRVDDLSNPWTGTCSSINASDICQDITTNSFSYNFQVGKSYQWWVHAVNSCGNYSTATVVNVSVPAPATPTPSPTILPTPTPTATPSPVPLPTPTPTPNPLPFGLKAEYFDNKDLTNLKLTRTDSNINFDWGYGSPNPSIGSDTFSVRWSGFVVPQYSETYTFYTLTNDGVRLWVNNQLLIDRWVNQPAKQYSSSINLIAGQKVSIKMEYYENITKALASLYWSSPSTPKQIVPAGRLLLSENSRGNQLIKIVNQGEVAGASSPEIILKAANLTLDPDCTNSACTAITYQSFITTTGEMTGGMKLIINNDSNKWNWYSGGGNTPAGMLDLKNTILHEIGHTLGLCHSNSPGLLMSAFQIPNVRIDSDAINGDRYLYDPSYNGIGPDGICYFIKK